MHLGIRGILLVMYLTCSNSVKIDKGSGDAEYYELFASEEEHLQVVGYRPGAATNSHSCGNVRGVPPEVRSQIGLDNFYQKYTEAYGIPILSSNIVPDAALQRACYVTRFLFADRYEVRDQFYKRNGRAAVMSQYEVTRDIPEHAYLDPYWDTRARGLGATPEIPVSSCAEENALCYSTDHYYNKDIVLHEFTHGLHLVGLNFAISGFDYSIVQAYSRAKQQGLWYNTYSMSTYKEYFAEGVGAYFGQKGEAIPTNGVDNWVNTREELLSYDPTLYNIVKDVFPCNNTFIDRCDDVTQSHNLETRLRINYPECHLEGEGGETTTESPTQNPTQEPTQQPTEDPCVDFDPRCAGWASQGECSKNPEWMLVNCMRSCGQCEDTCVDDNVYCADWANRGDCSTNPGYMLIHCRRSCGQC